MTTVRYARADGTESVLEVDSATSVMRAAVTAGVDGIVGECGGQAMCATCHIYVDERYADVLPPIGPDEDEMLDCTASPRTERSRLSCQLTGLSCSELLVEIPPRQQ